MTSQLVFCDVQLSVSMHTRHSQREGLTGELFLAFN